MDLLNIIKLHHDDFSKTELKVYEYVINHPETIETYTISKIADVSGTSTSAVLRFCQVLGFKGYKDFRFEMVKYLHENIKEQDSGDLWNQYINEYIKMINQFQNIDRDLIEQLIVDLKQNKKIYLFGIHYSSLPCRQLKAGLQDLGIMTFAGYDYMESAHLVNTVNEDDVIIFFSVSGAKNNFKRFLTPLINNLPSKSYLITMNPNSQLVELFNNVITIPGYTLTNQSVIDCEAFFLVFVEIVLNLLHHHA